MSRNLRKWLDASDGCMVKFFLRATRKRWHYHNHQPWWKHNCNANCWFVTKLHMPKKLLEETMACLNSETTKIAEESLQRKKMSEDFQWLVSSKLFVWPESLCKRVCMEIERAITPTRNQLARTSFLYFKYVWLNALDLWINNEACLLICTFGMTKNINQKN